MRRASWTSSDILFVIRPMHLPARKHVPLSVSDGMCVVVHGTLCYVERESGLMRALIASTT